MEKAFFSAVEQAEEILKDVDFSAYDDILFISKSVGTAVSAAYARETSSENEKHLLYAGGGLFSVHDSAGNRIHRDKRLVGGSRGHKRRL